MKRINRSFLGASVVASITALALVLPALADDPPIPAGTWLFVPEASEDIEPRIETAAAHLNVLIRRIARGRLRNANKPMPRLVISYPGSDVHISLRADEPTVITPRSGDVVPYTRVDGEVVQASTKFERGLIRQFFDSDDGQKEMVYRLRPDGTMAVETTVFSEKLREPFRYTWVYRRQG